MDTIKLWMRDNLKGDPVIWCIVLLLSLMSVLVVYSATGTLAYKSMHGNTEHYLIRHGLLVMLGLAAMWLAHKIDYL
jgi:cell division protein FtsW